MFSDFREFIVRGNVIDLAVGIVAGAAFSGVVSALVANVVTPMIGIVFALFGGEPDFSSYSVLAHVEGDWRWFTASSAAEGGILLGSFVNALITFLATMAGLFYLVVKPANALLARMQERDRATPPELQECPECTSRISARATRCMHCTIEVAPRA